MTDGVMKFDHSTEITCAVICGGWPSWVMGAEARGFGVRYVFTKANFWSKFIKIWFPKATLIEYSETFDWRSIDQHGSIWLRDVAPPRKLKFWETTARLFVSCRRVRHLPSSYSWEMMPISLLHFSCGGVTDGRALDHLYVPSIQCQSSHNYGSIVCRTRLTHYFGHQSLW
jgi:hypothetical protein